VLSKFAQECFVGGQAAYRLDDGSFSIDAGENDIRAIYDEPNAVIRFFCRYKRDAGFYDRKLQTFAAKHSITSSLTMASKLGTDGSRI